MNKVKLVLVIILSIAAGIFAYQNIAPTEVLFLRWHTELPLALLLFVPLVLGYLVGVTQMWLHARKKRRQQKQEKKSADTAAEGVSASPVAGEPETGGKSAAEVIIPPAAPLHSDHSSTSDTGGKV